MLLHHLSDGNDLASACMDVFHLAAHVLTGHDVAVSCCALAGTSCLRSNNNAIPLLGGIRGTRLCTGAVRPACGFAPATGRQPCRNRTHQSGAAEDRIACGISFCQAQLTVEVNLRAAAFGEDSSERNCVFTKGVLVFSAIDIAGDFSLIATFGKDLGVLADFGLGLRSSSPGNA